MVERESRCKNSRHVSRGSLTMLEESINWGEGGDGGEEGVGREYMGKKTNKKKRKCLHFLKVKWQYEATSLHSELNEEYV